MARRISRNTVEKLASGAIATVAHVALLIYLALNLKPFDVPPPEPPMNVEIVSLPPPEPLYRPTMRGRLDLSEVAAAPSPPAAMPAPPTEIQIQPPPPARQPAPEPVPVPRPPVLAASVIELAPEIPPEPQPAGIVSPALRASLNPEFERAPPAVVSNAAPLTASQLSAVAAARGVLNPSLSPSMSGALREASGAPGAPSGTPGVQAGAGGTGDDRWRVRPDGRPYADCPPIPPERMTPAQRARCAPRAPPLRGFAVSPEIKLRDPRFDEAAQRKAQIRTYKASPNAPYPGLRCVFGGKCAPPVPPKKR